MTNLASKGSIMVVDDEPANLKLMEEILTDQGFDVRSFSRGRLALAAAVQQPPDLILLDITMPEMDGFQVCERLKADKDLAPIPVIFLSALHDTEDKVKAFRSGGVDYITKPFQFEEVSARVEAHLQLQRSRRAERDLLEKTLTGAVRALADLAHLSGPALSARSEAIRSIVAHMASRMGLEEPWQYELAAMLCLIGCTALPPETFERVYGGEVVSAEEEQMFRAHPDNGSQLLANIPRLEEVAQMIHQQQAESGDSPPVSNADLGARMLRVALELDRRTFRGIPFETALDQLKAIPQKYAPEMLNALNDYSPPRVGFQIRRLPVQELRVSMIVEDDVLTEDGSIIIVHKGTTLSFTLIERIRNFAKTRGIRQPIHVRVTTTDHAGKSL